MRVCRQRDKHQACAEHVEDVTIDSCRYIVLLLTAAAADSEVAPPLPADLQELLMQEAADALAQRLQATDVQAAAKARELLPLVAVPGAGGDAVLQAALVSLCVACQRAQIAMEIGGTCLLSKLLSFLTS